MQITAARHSISLARPRENQTPFLAPRSAAPVRRRQDRQRGAIDILVVVGVSTGIGILLGGAFLGRRVLQHFLRHSARFPALKTAGIGAAITGIAVLVGTLFHTSGVAGAATIATFLFGAGFFTVGPQHYLNGDTRSDCSN